MIIRINDNNADNENYYNHEKNEYDDGKLTIMLIVISDHNYVDYDHNIAYHDHYDQVNNNNNHQTNNNDDNFESP